MMTKIIRVIFVFFICSFLLYSCAFGNLKHSVENSSVDNSINADSMLTGTGKNQIPVSISSLTPGAFAANRLSSLVSINLKNDISFTAIKMPGSSVSCLKAVFYNTEESDSLLDALVLCCASIASESFAELKTEQFLSQYSATLKWILDTDSVSLELKCPSPYLENLLEIFISAIQKPLINDKSLEKAKSTVLAKISKLYGDSETNNMITAFGNSGEFRAGTFEYSAVSYTEEISLVIKSISPDLLRNYHESCMIGKRFAISFAGDGDTDKISDIIGNSINQTQKSGVFYGKLPIKTKTPYKKINFCSDTDDNSDLFNFYTIIPAPPTGSMESVAYEIALLLLNDLVFEVIRSEKALCYSVETEYYPQSHAALLIGGIKDPEAVYLSVIEAIDILASGKKFGTEAANRYLILSDILDSYKKRLSIKYLEKSIIPSELTSSIAVNDFSRKNEILMMPDAIDQVNPQLVKTVLKKYFIPSQFKWFIKANPEKLNELNTNTFN